MDVATGGAAEEDSSRKRGLEVGEEEDDAATIELGKRLLAACKAGEEESVTKLLDEDKAPAYYQDPSDGMSCLMGAAQGGHEAIVGALLGAGAPWNALDRRGRCAGEYAMESGAQGCIDRLVDHAVMAELILGAAGEGVAAVQEESDRYLKGKVGQSKRRGEEDGWRSVCMFVCVCICV
jgi:protein arginine N-methyltransferase 2